MCNRAFVRVNQWKSVHRSTEGTHIAWHLIHWSCLSENSRRKYVCVHILGSCILCSVVHILCIRRRDFHVPSIPSTFCESFFAFSLCRAPNSMTNISYYLHKFRFCSSDADEWIPSHSPPVAHWQITDLDSVVISSQTKLPRLNGVQCTMMRWQDVE